MDIAEFIPDDTLLFILGVTTFSLIVTFAGVSMTNRLAGRWVQQNFLAAQRWPHLSESYPWDPRNFRFLGAPIDGVQFEDDMVVLVEFKSGRSRLSDRQLRIRDLVQNGRVEFREVRVDPGRADSMRVR